LALFAEHCTGQVFLHKRKWIYPRPWNTEDVKCRYFCNMYSRCHFCSHLVFDICGEIFKKNERRRILKKMTQRFCPSPVLIFHSSRSGRRERLLSVIVQSAYNNTIMRNKFHYFSVCHFKKMMAIFH
jgi:hypothetical protein